MTHDVVIAGGGFGGFYAARTLERLLPARAARITLVSDVDYMLFMPLLPGVVGASLEPDHVVVPLRESLRRTRLRLGRVEGADPERNVLSIAPHEGGREELRYDRLIVAVGSVSRSLPVPGLAEHGRGLKTLADAVALRNRLVELLEVAEYLEGPGELDAHLTFVFVGGGYAGVEGLAELQNYAAHVLRFYPRSRAHGLRWVLVEALDRPMPEISAGLAGHAARELRSRGVEVRTNTTVEEIGEDYAVLSDGERVPARTVAWTAGVTPQPVVGRLGLPLTEKGRIRVDRFMRVEGHEDVWAIGDAAAVPDPAKGDRRPSPPTAQHALRQGRDVAHNVAASLGVGHRRPFSYKTLGVFVDLGRHEAVAETLGLKWRGFPAWWLARAYHLYQMPGTRRRLRLVSDWTLDLLLGRVASDLSGLASPARLGSPPEPKGRRPERNGADGSGSARLPASPNGKKRTVGSGSPGPDRALGEGRGRSEGGRR